MHSVGKVRVHARTQDGFALGQVLQMKRSTSQVAFLGDCSLPVGLEHRLTFAHEQDSAGVTINALAVRRTESSTGTEYVFTHALTTSQLKRMPTHLRHLLDVRAHRRRRLHRPVQIALRVADIPALEGCMTDLSPGGCGVLLDRESDVQLSGFKEGTLAIHTGPSRPVCLRVAIRNRKLSEGEGLLVGRQFLNVGLAERETIKSVARAVLPHAAFTHRR